MIQQNTIKIIHDLQYYTGLHPELRKLYRKDKRPIEFGNKVWATSLILINHFQENPSDLQGLNVLEIGCGQGIVGIYLAKKYACNVTCSDFDQKVLPIVEMHAELNDIQIKTKQLAFNDITTDFLKNFDLIIGAEVCYSEEIGHEIIDLTKRAFKAGVKRVIIGDPGRPDFEDFQEDCTKQYKIETTKLPGSANGKETTLLSIYKTSSKRLSSTLEK